MKDRKYHEIVNNSNLPREEWESLIYQWCFDEKHRKMLEMNLLDNKSYMDIAYDEEINLSLQQVSKIMLKEKKNFFSKIESIINK